MIKIFLFFIIIYNKAEQISKLKIDNFAYSNNIKSLLENDDNSLKFIAFYNKNDLSDDDIYILNNFQDVINELVSEKLFNVEFYFYKDDNIPKEIEQKYHLFKYTLPKIKMNKSGILSTYKGSLKKYGIKNFIIREYRYFKIYYDSIINEDQLKDKYNKYNEIILYFGNKYSKLFLNFVLYSKKYSMIKFIYSDKQEVNDYIFKNISAKKKDYLKDFPFIYFIKRAFGNSVELFSIMHEEFIDIKKYLKLMRKNKLYQVQPQMMKDVLNNKEPFLMIVSNNGLYINETNEICSELSEIKCTLFKDIYKEFDFLSEFLNHKNGVESIYIIDPSLMHNNSYYKYKLLQNINKTNIKEFILNWKNNKLKPFWKSQKIINNSNNLVYELVANNYIETIEKSNCDVLMYIYKKECKICENVKIDYIKVAMYLNKYHNKIPLKLMMINGDLNEIPNLTYKQIPFFYIYSRKNYKSPSPAYFEFNYEGILYFIKKKTPFLNEIDNELEL